MRLLTKQAAAFLIEVSDFSQLHTCVKQMIMLLESFSMASPRWIWGALSHHANVTAHKNLPPLWRELFLPHYKESLPVTDSSNALLLNASSPFTIAMTVIIICFGYNTVFNMILSSAGPCCGLLHHHASVVRLIGTYHHYWTVSTVT